MSDPDVTATILPLGQDGIIVRFGNGLQAHPRAAHGFGDRVRAADMAGVTEVATSLASTYVRFAPPLIDRAALTARLRDLLAAPCDSTAGPPARLWTIPASFGGDDGPQLAQAAALAGLTPRDAVAEVTATDLSVLAIGFAPGQPYLGHLSPGWDMPRQTDLTPQVPAGALVVAIRQIVLFANASPTGWRWIGRCAFAPFRADRAAPFALRVGDRIRFAATDGDTIARLCANQGDGLGGATCTVTP